MYRIYLEGIGEYKVSRTVNITVDTVEEAVVVMKAELMKHITPPIEAVIKQTYIAYDVTADGVYVGHVSIAQF